MRRMYSTHKIRKRGDTINYYRTCLPATEHLQNRVRLINDFFGGMVCSTQANKPGALRRSRLNRARGRASAASAVKGRPPGQSSLGRTVSGRTLFYFLLPHPLQTSSHPHRHSTAKRHSGIFCNVVEENISAAAAGISLYKKRALSRFTARSHPHSRLCAPGDSGSSTEDSLFRCRYKLSMTLCLCRWFLQRENCCQQPLLYPELPYVHVFGSQAT